MIKKIISENYKRIIYFFCFLYIAFLPASTEIFWETDVRTNSLRDFLGIVIALIILMHYGREDYLRHRKPLAIWAVSGLFPAVFTYFIPFRDAPFHNDRAVMAMDVYVFGFAAVMLVCAVFLDKRRSRFDMRAYVIFSLMLLWACISHSDKQWPFFYLVLFGCLYLVDFTKEELEILFLGATDALTAGFFLLQGASCMFRPWSPANSGTGIRYSGLFMDCIPYGAYISTLSIAVFARIVYSRRKNSSAFIRTFWYLLFGVEISVIIYTGTRAAWVAVFLQATAAIILYFSHTGIKKGILCPIALLLSVVIMFYPTFAALRYLPAVFHHTVWFRDNYSESSIHSDADWNDPRYVTFEQATSTSRSRINATIDHISKVLGITIEADAMTPDKTPLLEKKDYGDYRVNIWMYYLKYQNILGHSTGALDIQMRTNSFFQTGAMNVFLQYSTDFGIPFIVMYLIMFVVGAIRLFRSALKSNNASTVALFMVLNLLGLGMFDYLNMYFYIHETFVFFAWLAAYQREDTKIETLQEI